MENHEHPPVAHAHTRHDDKKTLLALLSYIGPLVIISYAIGKDDPFVKFHVKQGLVVFAIEVLAWIVMSIIPFIWILWKIVHIGVLVLSVIGVVNAVQGREKELPLVGHLANNIKI